MVVLPWYVAGPVFGLLVVAFYALTNKRLGVSGSYLQAAFVLQGRGSDQPWRLWFFGGLLAGAAAASFGVDGTYEVTRAYGHLAEVVPAVWLPPLLTAAGVCIGYGARWAGDARRATAWSAARHCRRAAPRLRSRSSRRPSGSPGCSTC